MHDVPTTKRQRAYPVRIVIGCHFFPPNPRCALSVYSTSQHRLWDYLSLAMKERKHFFNYVQYLHNIIVIFYLYNLSHYCLTSLYNE